MDEEFETILKPSEGLRQRLLKEELKLRKKQPEAWTKTKFRKYANFRTKKKDVLEATAKTVGAAPKKVA